MYPLTSGYRVLYQFLLVLTGLMIVGAFAKGDIGFPGGLGFAMMYALIKDHKIRKRIRAIP